MVDTARCDLRPHNLKLEFLGKEEAGIGLSPGAVIYILKKGSSKTHVLGQN